MAMQFQPIPKDADNSSCAPLVSRESHTNWGKTYGFHYKLETRCLGQITRNFVKPEITQERGNCKICEYDAQENPKCKAYFPIAFRVFEVVENDSFI